ncbi:MAG: MoxR family ATPase [Acidobacteria bacterium]|nr:MoxR family ATPase [Acidobacteriota bacterium]
MSESTRVFSSIETTFEVLKRHQYLADVGLSTSLHLALRMEKPLFLEGEPGVGKTEVAKVLSRALDTPLIRLQCYEGLDLSQAVYEWNYTRQLLAIQAHKGGGEADTVDIFTEEFLLRRPLLQAIDRSRDRAAVLLIDELDRADEEFESFLLELLSDFQITVPELGTLEAEHRPIVIITSNRTREIHDALKRRCIYHWIDYPSFDKEVEIVRRKVPGLSEHLSGQIVAFIQAIRQQDLYKLPGIAETLDWAQALVHLDKETLDAATVEVTLGFFLKYQDDIDTVRGPLVEELLERASG